MNKTTLPIFLSILFMSVVTSFGATFYVSPSGDDTQDGKSPETAWQSIQRVNGARKEVAAGDQILFQRGGIWRGIVHPLSGEPGNPVVYGAYGDENLAKPTFYGSADASLESDWVEESANVWATKPVVPQILDGTVDANLSATWSLHTEAGTQVAIENQNAEQDGAAVRQVVLRVKKGEGQTNHIQLWGPEVKGEFPRNSMFLFRARCSKPCAVAMPDVDMSGYPYSCKVRASGKLELTPEWCVFPILLESTGLVPEEGQPVTFRWHASWGNLPSDCVVEFQPLCVRPVEIDRHLFLPVDVGNIIFDHGNFTKYHRCGMKKWHLEDLKAPGDYYYDASQQRVFLYWDENPGKTCESIELALRSTIIDQSCVHDVIYENLAVAYGAAHGFGGTKTARLIIRNCDLYYIGGGHQFTRPDGHPVRFGNAIEFWNDCEDNLVENNRIWEVYDAALTNQGKGSPQNPSIQKNITYRGNLIWNAEYSFEYWNRDGETSNILFENNRCFDAGYAWSHSQRPDVNGAHMMFYNNAAVTTNFVVRNNVFCESTEVCLRMDNDWRSGLTLKDNIYYQSEHPVIRFLVKTYYNADEMAKYTEETGLDKGSVVRKVVRGLAR